jgi:HopJ type III effector protein
MNTEQLLSQLNTTPDTVTFEQVMETITADYDYIPASFTNGFDENRADNKAGTNEGSCKIFSFSLLNNLSKDQTLHCFGDYFRKDVLENPTATDHANIRNFIHHGWDGIHFESDALTRK